MSMLINVISAFGNNSSIYPLLVRDCGIEASSKVIQAYNQNAKDSKVMAKHATRERFIDEYGTSLIWFGGVPAVEWICNKFINKKGINPAINFKLFENKDTVDFTQQNIENNIKRFKNLAPNEVKELEVAKASAKSVKNLTAAKYAAAIAIPVALMGFVLPKSNFALTRYLMDKDAKKGLLPEKYLKTIQNNDLQYKSENQTRDEYNKLYKPANNTQFASLNSMKNTNNTTDNDTNFKGFASFMTGLTHPQKMCATDVGLTVGRVTTARKKNEAIENGFRMLGMIYLNFRAPKKIEKGLDYLTNKIFGINPNLDPKIMANKRFLASVRTGKLELPKTREEVLEFLDVNPKSLFSKIVAKKGGVKYLENGIRDPRAYVDTKKVFELSQQMDKFAIDARKYGDVVKYANKAIKAKSVNILMNIAISSTLLAVALPQAQYALRRVISDSKADPGLL